jgi:biopolymer transport protein ExbB
MKTRGIISGGWAAIAAALLVAWPAAAADPGATEVALEPGPGLIQVKTVEADPPAAQAPAPEDASQAPESKPAAPAPNPAVKPAAPSADAAAGSVAVPPPEAEPTTPSTLEQLAAAGGWVMYGIYGCAAVALLVALERALALRSSKVFPREFIRNVGEMAAARPPDREKILTYCVASPGPIARIFHATVRWLTQTPTEIQKAIDDAGRKEVRTLRHNCRAISGAAWIAPLLGLLGAAIALIRHFMDVPTGDAPNGGALLADSLYRSLVPVAAGLAVAVPSAVVYLVLVARIEKLVAEMEDLALELAETLEGRHPTTGSRQRSTASRPQAEVAGEKQTEPVTHLKRGRPLPGPAGAQA